jgi:hypothetical protein
MKDLIEIMLLETLDLEDEKVLGKTLNCLINFANESYWIDRLAEEGIARKVFAVLKVKVKPDTQEVVAPIKIMETAPVTYEVEREGGTIQSCFMLLANLSATEGGQKHLLGTDKSTGLILSNLIGMFSYFTKNTAFDFVANILSNITNLKEGRKYIIEHKSLDSIMKLLMLGPSVEESEKLMSAHRRKHLLSTLRNVMFEYEHYEKDF